MRIGRSDEAHAVSFVYWAKERSYRFATPAKGLFPYRHELTLDHFHTDFGFMGVQADARRAEGPDSEQASREAYERTIRFFEGYASAGGRADHSSPRPGTPIPIAPVRRTGPLRC